MVRGFYFAWEFWDNIILTLYVSAGSLAEDFAFYDYTETSAGSYARDPAETENNIILTLRVLAISMV
jgi:hypothetical protein